jgi:hypothetical protein
MAIPQDTLRLFAGNLLPSAGEYQIDSVHTFAEFTALAAFLCILSQRLHTMVGANGLELHIDRDSRLFLWII